MMMSIMFFSRQVMCVFQGALFKRVVGFLGMFSVVLSMNTALAATSPVQSVPELDIERYMGTWYEIARYPNRFQLDCVRDVEAQYTRLDDGRITVENRCRLVSGEWNVAVGEAKQASLKGPNSRLKVRFAPEWLSWVPMVWGKYWVLALGPDYRYAVVGTPDREFLWVLARKPSLPNSDWEMIREQVREQGFDLKRLQFTRQSNR